MLRSVASCALLLGLLGCSSEPSTSTSTYDHIEEANAAPVFASELCDLFMNRCKCEHFEAVSREQCLEAGTEQVEEQFAPAQEAGLSYDGDCMAEHINLFTHDLGCKSLDEIDPVVLGLSSAPTCKVHYGTKQLGEECTAYPTALGDDCAQGLRCFGITCQEVPDVPDPVAPPQLDTVAEGEACSAETLCEPGTYCTDDVCVRGPGLGASCSPGLGCDVDLYCERIDTGIYECLPALAENEPCSGTSVPCATGLECEYHNELRERVCRGPLELGDSCSVTRLPCPDGSYCDETCQPKGDAGDPCWDLDSCKDGLTCDHDDDLDRHVCRSAGPLICGG